MDCACPPMAISSSFVAELASILLFTVEAPRESNDAGSSCFHMISVGCSSRLMEIKGENKQHQKCTAMGSDVVDPVQVHNTPRAEQRKM